jgi:hypothetical protein
LIDDMRKGSNIPPNMHKHSKKVLSSSHFVSTTNVQGRLQGKFNLYSLEI